MEAIEIDKTKRPAEGPGKLLTDARLKLGLEPQNVAEMLHLREYQIRALEADDFENLPEPTYVKGYLRAYCQLLSIDADKVIKMYSDIVQPPVRESFEGLATEKQAASNDNLVKLVSIAMVALVAGLAITFWLTNRQPASDEMEPATTEMSVAEPREAVPAPGINEPDQEADQPEAPPVAPQAPAEHVPQAEVKTPAKPESTAPKVGKPAPTEETSSAPAPAATEKPEVAPAAPVTSSAGLSKESSLLPDTDASAHTRLLIKVMQESWVDVRDAKGNKLIYESVPAGREIPLEGLAPFSVFLGNAGGVQVLLNGKPFDFSSHRRGQTARFKIAVKAGSG